LTGWKKNLNIRHLCGKDNSMPKIHEIFIDIAFQQIWCAKITVRGILIMGQAEEEYNPLFQFNFRNL
jgi:hypothetical protein